MVARLEPRIQQVSDGVDHGGVGVLVLVQLAPQRRLCRDILNERGEGHVRGSVGHSGARQDVQGQPVEGVDAHSGQRTARRVDEPGADVVGEAARWHDEANRPSQQ